MWGKKLRFLFGIPVFCFLVPVQIIPAKWSLALRFLPRNCQLVLQQGVLMLLCAKIIKQIPLILFSLLLASAKAVTVSFCSNTAHFLLFVLFFFLQIRAVMPFRSWKASGLDLHCSLASELFLV